MEATLHLERLRTLADNCDKQASSERTVRRSREARPRRRVERRRRRNRLLAQLILLVGGVPFAVWHGAIFFRFA